VKLFTIGFTQSSADHFFGRLERANVRRVVDTRLNRTSQLSGFSKQEDLRFFLKKIGDIDYSIEKLFAPSQEMLKSYRKKEISWDEYARRYLELLSGRKVEAKIKLNDLDHSCLLCSEASPDFCHRRLAANYIAEAVEGISVTHL